MNQQYPLYPQQKSPVQQTEEMLRQMAIEQEMRQRQQGPWGSPQQTPSMSHLGRQAGTNPFSGWQQPQGQPPVPQVQGYWPQGPAPQQQWPQQPPMPQQWPQQPQQPPVQWQQPQMQQPMPVRPLPPGVEPPKPVQKTPASAKKKRIFWIVMMIMALTTVLFFYTLIKYAMQ
jgi:hypothetical protein